MRCTAIWIAMIWAMFLGGLPVYAQQLNQLGHRLVVGGEKLGRNLFVL
jgi:hypothetical protein